MTWAQAQRFCEFMNADLPCIHSSKEYQFIQHLISRATHASGETWIGGSDGQEENYWFCLDGTHFTYAEWCQGEPNNYDRNEHCLLVNYSGKSEKSLKVQRISTINTRGKKENNTHNFCNNLYAFNVTNSNE
uniref:Ladderlectin-like n=1 Tax=Haplochromis burtoni TaxID=8153 RepID=A0A3Q2WNJ7_HAPBU